MGGPEPPSGTATPIGEEEQDEEQEEVQEEEDGETAWRDARIAQRGV